MSLIFQANIVKQMLKVYGVKVFLLDETVTVYKRTLLRIQLKIIVKMNL